MVRLTGDQECSGRSEKLTGQFTGQEPRDATLAMGGRITRRILRGDTR